MHKLMIAICMVFLCTSSHAQFNRYLIKFKNKANNPFSLNNPSAFMSQRAIARRQVSSTPIDSTDLPITPAYIDSIKQVGNVSILNASKWLNQISIQTTNPNTVSAISNFSFVENISGIAAKNNLTPLKNKFIDSLMLISNIQMNSKTNNTNQFNYGASSAQISIHHGEFLHNHGFRGDGMQMAIIDAGFYHYNTLRTFDSLNLNRQILGTWDFVNNEASVAEDDSHGMHCLSIIGANLPGVFVGSAPKNSFYLFRTEDVSSEYPIEEHNLAAAAEKADSLGVDMCSVSLGYTNFDNPIFDYTYNNLNGNTTISAKAVDLAAKKGLIMVIAAGNEGNASWHYISTPADADSAFTIGAVDTLGNVASFSSYGPSSDGGIKPNVASVGRNTVIANNFSGLPTYGSGTSYACPNMAGITSCLWQAFPEANNMQIIDALQKSASIYSNPNPRIGYGIPDAKNAFVRLQKYFSAVNFQLTNCKSVLNLSIKTDSSMSIELEKKFSTDQNYTKIFTFQNSSFYGLHQFNHEDDLSGLDDATVTYRIKVVIDADTSYYLDSSTFSFSNCKISLPVSNTCIFSPNPFFNNLNAKINRVTKAPLDFIIVNGLGQKVYHENYIAPLGYNVKQFNLNALSKGVYFISVFESGKKIKTEKIIKQ